MFRSEEQMAEELRELEYKMKIRIVAVNLLRQQLEVQQFTKRPEHKAAVNK
jgi:hypothetical protein